MGTKITVVSKSILGVLNFFVSWEAKYLKIFCIKLEGNRNNS